MDSSDRRSLGARADRPGRGWSRPAAAPGSQRKRRSAERQADAPRLAKTSGLKPNIAPRVLRLMLRELIDEPDEHGQRLNQLLGIMVPSILCTVRDAKRTLACFEVLYRLLRFEVDEVDLLGWAAAQAKYPGVEQVLRRRQEQIIGPGNRLFGEALLDRMLTGYHPAGVENRVSQPTTLDAAFTLQFRARPPGLFTFGATCAFACATAR